MSRAVLFLRILTPAQVFMSSKDTLNCIHEPFGDAFYYGPERLSSRFDDDEDWRIKTGFSNSTYQTVFDHLDKQESEVRLLSLLSQRQFPFCKMTCTFFFL
jgi:hypothetical protein